MIGKYQTILTENNHSTEKVVWPALKGKPVFLNIHLGKTAGSTFNSVLRNNSSSNSFAAMGPNDDNGRGVGQRSLNDFKSRFFALPPDKRRRIEFTGGHVSPGIWDVFYNAQISAICFSFIRDPVKRTLSSIGYDNKRSGEKHHSLLSKIENVETRLEKFDGFKNYQTVWLASDANDVSGVIDRETPALLEKAKRRVERSYLFLGLTERFDESLVLLSKMMAWPLEKMVYKIVNVTPDEHKIDINDLPVKIKKKLDQKTKLDQELYAWAEKRFDKLVILYDQKFGQNAFQNDLKRFKELNQRFNQQ